MQGPYPNSLTLFVAESMRPAPSPKRLTPRLSTLDTRRLPTLEAKAGSTPRQRGDAWMKKRNEALFAGGYTCVDCGFVSMDNEIDHDVPLEQGGSNDLSNLRVRCHACHAAKTKAETKARFGLT